MSKICIFCLYPIVPAFEGAEDGICKCVGWRRSMSTAQELDLEFLLDQIRATNLRIDSMLYSDD